MTALDRPALDALERRVLGGFLADPERVRLLAGPAWGRALFRLNPSLAGVVLDHAPDVAAIEDILRSAGAPGAMPGLVLEVPEADVRALVELAPPVRDHAAESKQSPPGLPLTLLPAGRLLDTDFPPVTFAVEPYFPMAEVTELVGAHGIFKSTAALGACCAVATGRRWGGAPTTKGRACFITMEDGERTIAHRVRAWLDGVPAGKERADAEADIRENLVFLAREHARELALTATDRTSTFQRGTVVEHLSELVKGSVLVVLETASRLHDGPEMNEALAVFAQAVERIATSSGAAVGVVRHTSKQGARDGTSDSYAGRGGGSFSDAARSVLVMTWDRKPEEGAEEEREQLAAVRLTHAKSTLTARGPRIVWKPVVTVHGVYLYPMSDAEELRADAQRLAAHLAACPDGLTETDLHKKRPAGLGRVAARAAMSQLVETGRALASEVRRGRTNQVATVYRSAP